MDLSTSQSCAHSADEKTETHTVQGHTSNIRANRVQVQAVQLQAHTLLPFCDEMFAHSGALWGNRANSR